MHASYPASLLAGILLIGGHLSAQESLTVGAVKDNTLFNQVDGLISNGSGRYFFVGRTGFNNTAQTRRGVIDFDLSGIPAGAKVLSAELRLQMTRTSSGPVPISLHRITQEWGEGDSTATGNEGGGAPSEPGDATWLHTFFPDQFWNSPGGDFVASPSASIDVGGLGAYTWGSTAGMVSDVQAWVDDPSSAHGWLLMGVESQAFTSKRFASRQNFGGSRPQLTVTYLPAASSSEIGMGCGPTTGVPLGLRARGLPSIGNQGFGLDLGGGPANGTALLFFAFFPAQTPLQLSADCFFYLDLVN
ncbi:MAG: DNRLRE domain-containing protein, partial [Planctomycetota bacterium]